MKLLDKIKRLEEGKELNLPGVNFSELFELKYPPDWIENLSKRSISHFWNRTKILAKTKKDLEVRDWDSVTGISNARTIPAGTKVLVWMISRMGDVGITDLIEGAHGYNCRTEVENLKDWIFTKN